MSALIVSWILDCSDVGDGERGIRLVGWVVSELSQLCGVGGEESGWWRDVLDAGLVCDGMKMEMEIGLR